MAAAEGALGESGPGRKPTLRERVEGLPYYSEVESSLVKGESLASTVRLIHDRGDLVDVPDIRLIATLDRIRLKLPRAPAASLAVAEARTPGEVLQEIAHLKRLFAQQLRRIAMDHKLEKKLKKALPSVGREIDLAFRLRQGIQQLKMDVGLLKKLPPEYGVAPPPPPSLAHLPLPKDPAARARVINAIHRIRIALRKQYGLTDGQGGAAAPAPGDGDPGAGAPEGDGGPQDPAGDSGGSTAA